MNLLEEHAISCPYCGETITILIDCSCPEQSYTEDCQVCCRPMVIDTTVDEDGLVSVFAKREDD
ncbi:MAG: CPXCG motif-containing cysteine-rich protein [Cellvibrio sp.]|jgi:hypothetical protein